MPERPARKSVNFSEGTTVVHGNGEIEETNGTHDNATAESHSTGECPDLQIRKLS